MSEDQIDLSGFFDTTDFTSDTYVEWCNRVFASRESRQRFAALISQHRESAETGDNDPLPLAMAALIVGRYSEALELFAKSRDGKVRRFFAAQAAAALDQFDTSISELDRAAAAGWDAFEVNIRRAEIHLRSDDPAAARKILEDQCRGCEDRAEWHYIDGMLVEREGDYVAALEAYERAAQLNPDHAPTLFRAAFLYDLRGLDSDALDLYQRLSERPAAQINALMNLSVLFEDRGRYEEARACLLRVLSENPNHIRARLFLRDVESSMGMLIDEDSQAQDDTRTKLLEQPISEFELSVRSRNCLKKMNIYTLGDLLRISEAELLAYKNFGDTSLTEIKSLLDQQNLELGQVLEDQAAPAAETPVETATTAPAPAPAPLPTVSAPPGSQALMFKSVSELELSVRARKCLQRLNIGTIGILVQRTEDDLLSIRNFGSTSLVEIKARLADLGLSLAETKSE